MKRVVAVTDVVFCNSRITKPDGSLPCPLFKSHTHVRLFYEGISDCFLSCLLMTSLSDHYLLEVGIWCIRFYELEVGGSAADFTFCFRLLPAVSAVHQCRCSNGQLSTPHEPAHSHMVGSRPPIGALQSSPLVPSPASRWGPSTDEHVGGKWLRRSSANRWMLGRKVCKHHLVDLLSRAACLSFPRGAARAQRTSLACRQDGPRYALLHLKSNDCRPTGPAEVHRRNMLRGATHAMGRPDASVGSEAERGPSHARRFCNHAVTRGHPFRLGENWAITGSTFSTNWPGLAGKRHVESISTKPARTGRSGCCGTATPPRRLLSSTDWLPGTLRRRSAPM
jgi:hypothetical protein